MIAGGCSTPQDPDWKGANQEPMSGDQLIQTDFNRTVTLAMRDNLASLYTLLDKLYRRNPNEWRKAGHASREAAVADVRALIEARRPPKGLAGFHDIQILSMALDPDYQDDRVAAFIYGLADTLITAHGGKTRFYVLDVLDGQHVYNAARNVEAAAWLLASRRTASGAPLLLANEMSATATNLSFEREFGAIIGRLDLVANLLGENMRRVGINYAQGLLLFNFLPVR
ncbi:lipoprotein [Pigmentiphaga soli]|uniref:Lipoprotein n=1 Tax=Pigmentiphaga soli TaxID=1007095 RepID=A0ABP8GUX2_9BURK